MSPSSTATLPDFDQPPVSEVVCGVLFKPIEEFLTPHVGLLWERFRSEFPRCEEVPPLVPILESFEKRPNVAVEISTLPPFPRIWFVHATGNSVIQIQRDRFLVNWRRVQPGDEYPRYRKFIQMYRTHLSAFFDFLRETGLPSPSPSQYEMSYINHIPCGDGWKSFQEIGQVFPDLSWRHKTSRFLADPEHFDWKTSFPLPDRAGRLRVSITTGMRRQDDAPVLILDLTARGMSPDASLDGMMRWHDLAHTWMVRSFEDLTSAGIQQSVWRKRS